MGYAGKISYAAKYDINCNPDKSKFFSFLLLNGVISTMQCVG